MYSPAILRALPWIVAAVVGLIYLPALDLGYVWDDTEMFLNNPALRTPGLAWQAIFEPIIGGTTYLRPLVMGSFASQFLLFGIDPAIAHGVNLGIHLANTLLVGLIAVRLTAAAGVAPRGLRIALAPLFYGLHPALIEPVAWTVGRFDLMVTLFCLLGIWAYLSSTGAKRNLLVAACFLLAALSKEMAAVFPLLILLLYIGRQGARPEKASVDWWSLFIEFFRSREWRLFLALAAVAGVVLLLRLILMGRIAQSAPDLAPLLQSPFDHLAFIGQTLLFYVRMSLWPFPDINPQHPMNPALLGPFAQWIGVLAVALGLVLTALLVRSRRWPALLAAGWAIALLPVLNIVPLPTSGNVGHERFLTLPLAMLALAVALVSTPPLSAAMRRALPMLAGTLAGLFLVLSVANIRVTLPLWTSNVTLWTWVYARYPNVANVQLNYIASSIQANRIAEAEQALEAAPQPLPPYLAGLQGWYLVRTGRPAQALGPLHLSLTGLLRFHEMVLSAGGSLDDSALAHGNPQWWRYQATYSHLAEAHLGLRDFVRALEYARTSLFYSPHYPPGLVMKSFALYGLDRWDEAQAAFAQGLEYHPQAVREQPLNARTDYLTKLCDFDGAPTRVCAHWRQERETRSKRSNGDSGGAHPQSAASQFAGSATP